jgi:hypothetical protein
VAWVAACRRVAVYPLVVSRSFNSKKIRFLV